MWGSAVSVATPRGDEGGVVSIIGVEGYTVVTIPCIEDEGPILPGGKVTGCDVLLWWRGR